MVAPRNTQERKTSSGEDEVFTGRAELKAQVGNVAEGSGKLKRNLKGRVGWGWRYGCH